MVVGITRSVVLRGVLREHEISSVTRSIEDQVRLGVEPAITPGLLAGDADSFGQFDDFVRRNLLTPDTLRLTLYTADGTVVWALLPDRVGDRDTLPAEAVAVLQDGKPSAQHTDPHGTADEAVEVLALTRGPGGERLLWEADLPREELAQRADRVVLTVAILELVGLGLLLTVQGLLGRSIVRRHDRERAYRRWLTQRASEVALVERRQIAADLHDGVVQDLTGLALDLEAPVGRPAGLAEAERRDRREFAARLRAAVRQPSSTPWRRPRSRWRKASAGCSTDYRRPWREPCWRTPMPWSHRRTAGWSSGLLKSRCATQPNTPGQPGSQSGSVAMPRVPSSPWRTTAWASLRTHRWPAPATWA
jgi:hypothetical protein